MTLNETQSRPAWPTGFEIRPRVAFAHPELIDGFKAVAVAQVGDVMGRTVGAVGLLAYHGDAVMCGSAVTVRVRPGDNLMIHKALELVEPGDVLVVDGGGCLAQALVGGLMRETAITRGVAGFVINGAVRDVPEFRDSQFGCFALGHNHRGPSKDGPGEINVPVSCAGLTVAPGDLVMGDADGVLAMTPERAREILPLAQAHAAKEDRQREQIRAGTGDPDRFDSILRAKGVDPSLLGR